MTEALSESRICANCALFTDPKPHSIQANGMRLSGVTDHLFQPVPVFFNHFSFRSTTPSTSDCFDSMSLIKNFEGPSPRDPRLERTSLKMRRACGASPASRAVKAWWYLPIHSGSRCSIKGPISSWTTVNWARPLNRNCPTRRERNSPFKADWTASLMRI